MIIKSDAFKGCRFYGKNHTVITTSAVFRQLHKKEKAALAGCSVTVPEEGLASGTAREQHSALR
jgi:hypothetical protein